jgi:hypothetical protein
MAERDLAVLGTLRDTQGGSDLTGAARDVLIAAAGARFGLVSRALRAHERQRLAKALRVVLSELFVEIAQGLFELFVREHFLELAPRGFAAFALVACALVYPVQQAVVVGAVLGGSAQKFIVEIEALVVSFRHLAVQILK